MNGRGQSVPGGLWLDAAALVPAASSLTPQPRLLKAPSPGWTASFDVVVIGSGIGGLATAIHARRAGYQVLVVTKAHLNEGSTRWAQGGIAAALADDDTPAEHLQDTLDAGAGLSDPSAARVLVYEGPEAVRRLVRWGTEFDRDRAGGMRLTREGGHHRNRIAHAGGDATGVEISRALVRAVTEDPRIEVIEHALALDLLQDDQGAIQGVTLHVMGTGQRDGVGAVLAPAVVVATGGVGQVFAASTNPPVATGDGIAMAFRAGAALADLEFTQFHPTAMFVAGSTAGQQPLVSEALRGEGARLRCLDGAFLMDGVDPLGDLAARDVVAKRMTRYLRESGNDYVLLDARHLNAQQWQERFPTIWKQCRQHGISPDREQIPVVPAQHYLSGGIATDLHGRTSVEGLFAVGECACTGVHGANRLASNSLLEGLVFAHRIGAVLAAELPPRRPVRLPVGPSFLVPAERRADVQAVMTHSVSVLRSQAGIESALRQLGALYSAPPVAAASPAWETSNVLTVASMMALAAAIRTETRGSHWREDYPGRDDENWRHRILLALAADGSVVTDSRRVTGE